MCNKIKYPLFFIAFFLFFSNLVSAQIKITSIQIEGNRRTKPYIILRELPYHEGDMISKDSLVILFLKSKILETKQGYFQTLRKYIFR